MTETCVCCGEVVPEGRMVCLQCEHSAERSDCDNDSKEARHLE